MNKLEFTSMRYSRFLLKGLSTKFAVLLDGKLRRDIK